MRFANPLASILLIGSASPVAAADPGDPPIVQLPGFTVELVAEGAGDMTMTDSCVPGFGEALYLSHSQTNLVFGVTPGSEPTGIILEGFSKGDGTSWPTFDAASLYHSDPRLFVAVDPEQDSLDDLFSISSDGAAAPFLTDTLERIESLAADPFGLFHHRLFVVAEGGKVLDGKDETGPALRRIEPDGSLVTVAALGEPGSAQIVFSTGGVFDEGLYLAHYGENEILRIGPDHEDGDDMSLFSNHVDDPIGLAFSPGGAWPDDVLFVTDPHSEAILMLDDEGEVVGAFATNVPGELPTLLMGRCGPIEDCLIVMTEDDLWKICPEEAIEAHYIPKRVRLKPNLKSNKPAMVQTRGTAEVGPDPIDLSSGATVEIGDYAVAVPGTQAQPDGKFTFENEDNTFKILIAHEGGSKMRFKLTIEDDALLDVMDSPDPMIVRFSSQEVEVGAKVALDDGQFQIGKKIGQLLEPELYFYRCRGKYVGPGQDKLQLRFGIGQGSDIAKVVGDTMPDLTVRCGGVLDATIPGGSFVKKGEKFVFKGDTDGVRRVVYDVGRERMILDAKKLDLGDPPAGPLPVLVELTVGSAHTSASVIMVRQGDKLRY